MNQASKLLTINQRLNHRHAEIIRKIASAYYNNIREYVDEFCYRSYEITKQYSPEIYSKHNKSIFDRAKDARERLRSFRDTSRRYCLNFIDKFKLDVYEDIVQLEFLQIIPDEMVILVNMIIAKPKDLQRIKAAFPEYTLEFVKLSYADEYNKGLSDMRKQ